MTIKASDIWPLLTILIVKEIAESTEQGTDRCILNFTQQPVASVDCNVYESDLEVLTCRVESIDTAEVPDAQDLSIKWFFYNNTEYEPTIGTNPVQRTGGNGGHLTVTSMLHISGTSQPNASFVSVGFYYCKVHMFDASVVLHESQRFEVFHREEYLQQASSCSERTFSTALESCAVSRLSIDDSTTTTSTFSPGPGSTATTTLPDKEDTTTISINDSQSTSSLIFTNSNQNKREVPVWIYTLIVLVLVFLILIIIILTVVCVHVGVRMRQSKSQTIKKDERDKDTQEAINDATQMNENPAYFVHKQNTETNINLDIETYSEYEIV